MQRITLNKKGDVVLLTNNGRMENGEVTSEIKGDFVCDEETAASLYLKGRGFSLKVCPPIDCYIGEIQRECYILTDDEQIKQINDTYEENISKWNKLYSDLRATNHKLQRQNEIYENNWFVRLFLKKKKYNNN